MASPFAEELAARATTDISPFKSEINKRGPQREVVSTPLPDPTMRTVDGSPSALPVLFPFLFSSAQPTAVAAAEAGVEYGQDKGAPRKARLLAALSSPRSQQSMEVMGAVISSVVEAGVPPPRRKGSTVRRGEQTGEWEYYDPKTKRFTLFNPPGPESGDLAGMAPGAAQIIAEVVGTLGGTAGGVAAGGPAGATAGGIVGGGGAAFGAEYARLRIGQNYGVNLDLSTNQMIAEAAIAAGLSVTGSGASLALSSIAKRIDNFIGGRVFTDEMLENYRPGMAQARSLEEMLNSRLPKDQQIKFDLAQATDDPQMLATKEAFLKTPGKMQAGYIEARDSQAQAINEFWDTITKDFSPAAGSVYRAGKAAQSAIGPRYRMALGASGKRVEQATVDAQKALGIIPTGSEAAASAETAKAIRRADDKFKAWAGDAAGKLQEMIGPNPIIKNSKAAQVVRSLSLDAQEALFPSLHKPKQALIGNRVKETIEIPENIRLLRESITGDPQASTQEILNKLFDPNAKFTFQETWKALSDLKRAIRISEKGLTTEAPDVAALKRLVGALEEDLHTSFKGTPYAAAYDAFKARYGRQIEMLDDLKIAASLDQPLDVFKKLFKHGDPIISADLHAAVFDDPAAMESVRKAILGDYRQAVMKDGEFSAGRHEMWMERYSDQAMPFFRDTDLQSLRQAGGMMELAEKEAARNTEYERRLARTFGAELVNADPATIMKKVYGPQKGEELRRYMLMVTPAAKKELKKSIMADMDARISVRQGDQTTLSFAKLKTYLEGTGTFGETGHKQVLRQAMGDKYMDDLEILYKALGTAQREVVGRSTSGTSYASGDAMSWLLRQGSRALVGPLSPINRRITFALRARERRIQELMADAILNPEKLDQIVSLRNLSPTSKKAAMILGQLGALEVFGLGTAEDTQPEGTSLLRSLTSPKIDLF